MSDSGINALKNAMLEGNSAKVTQICESEAASSQFAFCVDAYCEVTHAFLAGKLAPIIREALLQLLS